MPKHTYRLDEISNDKRRACWEAPLGEAGEHSSCDADLLAAVNAKGNIHGTRIQGVSYQLSTLFGFSRFSGIAIESS